jgi:hypothetical protein
MIYKHHAKFLFLNMEINVLITFHLNLATEETLRFVALILSQARYMPSPSHAPHYAVFSIFLSLPPS